MASIKRVTQKAAGLSIVFIYVWDMIKKEKTCEEFYIFG